MLKIKNLTAEAQPLFNYPGGEVPGSTTVDLEAYDFSFTVLIEDFDFYVAVKADIFVLVADNDTLYSKAQTLAAIATGLNPISAGTAPVQIYPVDSATSDAGSITIGSEVKFKTVEMIYTGAGVTENAWIYVKLSGL